MGISVWQILIIAVIVILLFGRGKISDLMGDVAKGIKSFKKGMAEDDTASSTPEAPKTIDHQAGEPVAAEKAEDQSKAS
ncbi:twin-arginine translocase TatA/TatE family subunit [Roseibium polysiphoniae]|uniref:Sec-independent protein translocase protein TatA n=1 Tax=Roseibium polysiphoniae TaxID=2571221 RepID=A0A927KES1_9HYPH|nr:twin-arginine translocase TatA/TatE family subunit [Roseibium polysiphoniae]MBD8878770.1 twin-arginine translocase TatA/TatE family subunit [Roseibium polysiphoniae]MBS8259275.1 twin-arginine translocase TatA/TatE family subunit [Roseibium polysiphoniae]